MYYTVIKHDGHLRTRGKCRKHEPEASVFYISRVFSNVRCVLSLCNTRLRLLHLLYDVEVMWPKTIKHTFSMFYTLIKHGFLTNQSECRVLSICIYIWLILIWDLFPFCYCCGGMIIGSSYSFLLCRFKGMGGCEEGGERWEVTSDLHVLWL